MSFSEFTKGQKSINGPKKFSPRICARSYGSTRRFSLISRFFSFIFIITFPFPTTIFYNVSHKYENNFEIHEKESRVWSIITYSYAKPLAVEAVNEDIDEEMLSESIEDNSNCAMHSSTQKSATMRKENVQLTLNQILVKAGKRGLGSGIPGAIAGVAQVLTLMWLRTITSYQYRYGTTFAAAFQTLFKQGGVARFYRGLWFALIQAPLSRFGSTAANDGVDALLSSFPKTKNWGPGRGTFLASIIVGLWRIALMPIDTCKTVFQVDSLEGFRNLMRKVRVGKIHLLYQGAKAQAAAAIIAHYPWFFTYNTLSRNVKLKEMIKVPLLRNAAIGFVASVVSDTISNGMRVVKTTKQVIAAGRAVPVGYGEAVSMILAADGWKGLLGRGLKTRIFTNGLQSVVFTVIWRGLSKRFRDKETCDKLKS